ncbi:conserved Plasmodium protein, unknown function [Plasmodium gallinaceum]|uniref:Uncharacterized protein n=1 Tax=Plasmodium gallinaceum TaxID=5849 RepID=A0A1J1GZY1_PLAGA|nr:conserved Plasmodium protein, unknown function [Plasmodium gallinaceum]CRG98041.1 conserved Plasmodium protein, unknown function [Plasmodium gallinaceum]
MEVIGEGCKVIVLRKTDLEEEKTKIHIDNLKNLYKELDIVSYDTSFKNIIFFYIYFHLFKHIHFYSYIFIKNSVIKIVKKNEIKNFNIALQHNWVKKLSYNKSKIFDNRFFAYNNFVVFYPHFTKIIRKTIDLYHDEKKKTLKKILINKKNSDSIIEKKFSKIKNIPNYITSVKNIFNLKKDILNYFKKLSNNILQFLIIFYTRKLTKIANKKKKNKYMFKEIYNSHDFIYNSNSKKNDFGYLEENLFSTPSYILGNEKNNKMNTILNKKNRNKNEKYVNDKIQNKTKKNIINHNNEHNDILNSSKKDIKGIYKIDKIYNSNVFNNNDEKKIEKLDDMYISIELKLKCGISDYKNMFDRYNIQQLIKKKNENIKYPSLYIPSNFFNLHYLDIFTNLNYIFLFKSNNINFYINNKKYENTSPYFFNYLSNIFFNNSTHLLISESHDFYFNYLNEYKNTRSFLFYTSDKQNKKTCKKNKIKHFRNKLNHSKSINNYLDFRKNVFINEDFILHKNKIKENYEYSHNCQIKKYNKKGFNFKEISRSSYESCIFSNYFYIKYILCRSFDNNMKVLYSREKEHYNIFSNKLLYFLCYKNIYNNIMRYYKKWFYLNEKKCYVINEHNLKDKLNITSQKENINKNNKLENYECYEMNKEKIYNFNSSNLFNKSSFFFIHIFNLFFIKKKHLNRKYNTFYINENSNIRIFKKKCMEVKKYYNQFYNVYKKVSEKFKKKISILSKSEIELKKKIYKKIKGKAKKNFLYKINKKLYYLYNKKFNKKYFFNFLIIYKLNIIKKYINSVVYSLINIMKKVKIILLKKIYKNICENVICFFNRLNKFFIKKMEAKYKISENKEILENKDFIKNVHYRSLKIEKNPYEISKNNEILLILSTIVRKERYLFYKLLYFQCFNAGQVQLIYCMMNFIKIFEKMFDLNMSEEFFNNFEYYNKSLNNIFNINTNYYIKKNKYLLHVINTKKIKRLADYIFNSKKKKRENIKYSSFIYLQNSHFILGNEILIDAMNIFNKVTNYKFNDLRIEMKKNTRKLYMELCKQKVYKKKEYYFRYNHKKKKYKKQVRKILSNESLITIDHFQYLTNKSFVDIFNSVNYSKGTRINKKVLYIYKSMIYFICRFLISKTFCDHSTIFNIYSKGDNLYDQNTSIFLRNNRFKLLILNKTNNNVTIKKNYNTKKFNCQNENQYKNASEKMKKKYITKNTFYTHFHPSFKTHLKRRKLRYNSKINKKLQKILINKYIKEKNKQIFYRISLIDLSIKSINKIDYWTKQMGDIISTHKKFCFN